MAVPRWFMNAADDGFSLIGKAFKEADPAVDAMMRVVARRVKSQPGSKFYDPEQDIMEKIPAQSWKEALTRMRDIKVTSDKDADVVTPWKWKGARPDERAASDRAFTTGDAIKQFDKAARTHKDAAGNMQRAKPFGSVWKESYEWMSTPDPSIARSYPITKKEARRELARSFKTVFSDFERDNFPREWTGEAAIATYKKARNEYSVGLFNKGTFTNTYMGRESTNMRDAVINADVPHMTNKERSLFFSMYPDWDGNGTELGEFVRLTIQMD